MAGRQGFEPRFHGPEPCVLPLDDLPTRGSHPSQRPGRIQTPLAGTPIIRAMSRAAWREAAAEFLGTLVLIVFGTGVVAEVLLSEQKSGMPLSIHLSWGLGVTLGIYVSAGVSGAHLNPAVTLALAALRGFPWRKVPAYVLAQTAGAFCGAALTFLTYREAFDHFDSGTRQVTGALGTAGIFATYPQAFLSIHGGFVDQLVGTALLMLGIFAIADR